MMYLWPLHLCINYIHLAQQVNTARSYIVDCRNGYTLAPHVYNSSGEKGNYPQSTLLAVDRDTPHFHIVDYGNEYNLTSITCCGRKEYTTPSIVLTVEMNIPSLPHCFGGNNIYHIPL
jgi:hypothetical protein